MLFDFGRFLRNLFSHSPSKVYSIGILPGICFAVAVNLMFFICHLAGVYFPLASSKFVLPCVFLWLAIWIGCLVLFAGHKIANEKVEETLARIFSL